MTQWLKMKMPLRINMIYNIKCECGFQERCPLQSEIAQHISFPQRKLRSQRNLTSDTYTSIDMYNQEVYRIEDMLCEHFKEDIIEDFQCGGKDCKNKTARRTLTLQSSLPDTICLHLQRLYWTGTKMKKINNKVLFCNRITIKGEYLDSSNDREDKNKDFGKTLFEDQKGYQTKRVIENSIIELCQNYSEATSEEFNKYRNEDREKYQDQSEKDENDDENDEMKDLKECDIKDLNKSQSEDASDVHYYLKSVIVHSGEESCGHYICFKKYNDSWYYTSDTSIREVNVAEVFRCNPYIMFYEREDREEIFPTILKKNYNLNTWINALSSCVVFINWLNKMAVNNDNEVIKGLLYLTDLANGNVTRNEGFEKIMKIDMGGIFGIYKRVIHILKWIESGINMDNVKKLEPNTSASVKLPMMVNLKGFLDCQCGFYDNKSSSKMIIKLQLSQDPSSVQDLINIFLKKHTFNSSKCENKKCQYKNSSQIFKLDHPLPNMICFYLDKSYKRLTLNEKIVIKKSFIDSEERVEVEDKEYYLKSVVNNSNCYRYVHGLWYSVNNTNVYITNDDYNWDGSSSVLFYDTSPMECFHNKNLAPIDYNTFVDCQNINVKVRDNTDIVTPKVIVLNEYLNSFIQAISSCIRFIKELHTYDDLDKSCFEHLLYLINVCDKRQECIKSKEEKIKTGWLKDISSVHGLITCVSSKLFPNIREKRNIKKEDPIGCRLVRRISCSCGYNALSPIEYSFFININIKDSKPNLHNFVDVFFKEEHIDGKVCENMDCSKDCGKQSYKICLPLSKTICINIISPSSMTSDFTFSDSVIIKKEHIINENDNNATRTSDEKYELRSVIMKSEQCCYRKIEDKWYEVTNKYSNEVNIDKEFSCKPYLLFYEYMDVKTFDEPLKYIIYGLSTCTKFVKWLTNVKDSAVMIKGKYLYERINFINTNDYSGYEIISKWNDSRGLDIYTLLQTILKDIEEEMKKERKVDEFKSPLLIFNITNSSECPLSNNKVINVPLETTDSSRVSLQQYWDKHFVLYSNERNSVKSIHFKVYGDSSKELLLDYFPRTIAFHISECFADIFRLNEPFELIMRNNLCSSNKENCQNYGNCCKKYYLKSVIDKDNYVYKVCHDELCRVVSCNFVKTYKESEKLTLQILFYE